MDAPPIHRLVDLVHAFNGVVVEQFKKRLEKLRSDSILLWRLLKLLFKILQTEIIFANNFTFQTVCKRCAWTRVHEEVSNIPGSNFSEITPVYWRKCHQRRKFFSETPLTPLYQQGLPLTPLAFRFTSVNADIPEKNASTKNLIFSHHKG